ncbi:uncharacterized protein ALTATR162_LOCUS6777 [Alternaria atra]|uniref:Uncharacterized protein n=1 Tax=Alternaria atra TaxID=119953 RepID=A0A8J2N7M4_9PLEO|nr:uncharacterized protein ALTATR162_LOCUS6777 [Alternaria atra]CAG5165309.1 unnamed protein product [Alternaria atra]
MVSALPVTGERPLLEHLFWNPVTLADLDALVPALIESPVIMDQLVVNIGYFNAYGLIPWPDLEHMLIHLLAVGDDRNHLYETAKARIELERKRRQHVEHVDRQKRVKSFGKTDTIIRSVQHCETIGDFSRSRLHNGPGLTDRKHPKVRLPQNDTRRVSPTHNLLVPETNTRVEHVYMWAENKCSSDSLISKMQRHEIVVKLQPKEPAPSAQIPTRTLATKETSDAIHISTPKDRNVRYGSHFWTNRDCSFDEI